MQQTTDPEHDSIEQYLQHVADHLRPFVAWEKVNDGIYLLRAGEQVDVGPKMSKELLGHGYAIESVYQTSLRVRRLDLSGGELAFTGK